MTPPTHGGVAVSGPAGNAALHGWWLPLSGGELHCAADRFSAAYRRWLSDIGFNQDGC
jgi:hypothetical protein